MAAKINWHRYGRIITSLSPYVLNLFPYFSFPVFTLPSWPIFISFLSFIPFPSLHVSFSPLPFLLLSRPFLSFPSNLTRFSSLWFPFPVCPPSLFSFSSTFFCLISSVLWLFFCPFSFLSFPLFLFPCGPLSNPFLHLAFHCIPKPRRLLPNSSPDWFYLTGTGLRRLSWKRGR